MKDEGWRMKILICWGVLLTNRHTNRHLRLQSHFRDWKTIDIYLNWTFWVPVDIGTFDGEQKNFGTNCSDFCYFHLQQINSHGYKRMVSHVFNLKYLSQKLVKNYWGQSLNTRSKTSMLGLHHLNQPYPKYFGFKDLKFWDRFGFKYQMGLWVLLFKVTCITKCRLLYLPYLKHLRQKI